MKRKIEFIEWLRVISAIAVIGIHVTITLPNNSSIEIIGMYNYIALTGVYTSLQWAVAVFLMISGYLHLQSDVTIKKVVKMMLRMGKVLIVFGTLYAILEQVFSLKSFKIQMVPVAFLMTLEQRSWSHLWYLYVMIGIYLILIPLKKFVVSATKEEMRFMVGILLIGNFVIPTINVAVGTKLETYMIFSEYVTYFIVGYVIGKSEENKYLDEYGSVKLGCIFAAATLTKVMIQIVYVLKYGEGSPIVLNDRILSFVQAISIFYIVRQCLREKCLGRVAKSISECSFGIYLIHPLFINLLYKGLNVNPISIFHGNVWIGIVIIWSAVFLCSWFTIWTVKKLKVIGDII